ncbi:hypothetical protein GCM10010300_81050 [Streptomyces olivaceoviridis]|uniref:HYD1 signature containing ADP-ribosyltransferase family protein n=1 Tax=Streptomyces olivaceoviridis TaxID=1921 RepID=UPI001676D5F1|nr:HYD1 signature containing ADP-ribosyltransferase family protein [Streptomyces olivaceoviridis]GGZ25468.1 hypothetical protein GCM10010300_81050 [Streptomyces olivaceoviridis]
MTPADPQSLNAYAYANNSPVTSSDPSGLCMADQCGIGYPIGGTGTNGHKKEYVKKAPRGAGGVGAPHFSGAGYTGPLPAAANGDSNSMAKIDDEWHVKIYPGVYMPADNPHVNEVATKFIEWVNYNCGSSDFYCLAPSDDGSVTPADYTRVKGMMYSCEKVWDCGKYWANPSDTFAVGAEAGLVTGNGQGGRVAARGARRGTSAEGGPCSFDPDTLVLLADGTSKPIVKVKPGDRVESGDPENGKHKGSRKVTAAFVNHDDDLIDVQVQDLKGKVRTLRTTSLHPFWDDTTHTWVQAGKLKAGHLLNTTSDRHVRITTVKQRAGSANMYNLTVSDLHTYYVLAGETPVLVHNSGGCPTTLYHYTNEAGHDSIIGSGELRPSLKANNPKDARYGDGQYLTDIKPGTKTLGQLSAAFLRVPWAGRKFTHYIEIDVRGLEVVEGRPGVFVIPNNASLDLTGRIRSSGRN